MKINPHAKGAHFKNSAKRSASYGVGINPIIFKAYDIRGVYPEEINERSVYKIGRAFVRFLNKRKLNIAVGRDGRISSPALFRAIAQGITDENANVIDIGLATSPMLYWATAYFQFDGGISITSSHNPAVFNGLKLVREKSIPISEESGLKKIKDLVIKEKFKKQGKGKVIKKNILKNYAAFILRDLNFEKNKSFKIAIDTANAVPGILISEIFKDSNFVIYHLFSKLDGNFPNHLPNPLLEENLEALKKMVREKKADLGIAFDGDGDRVIFVDEKGKAVPADFITALVSKLILEENPEEKILYDIRSSNIVREVIKEGGGKPIVSRIGHSFIKEKMRKEDIIFAGEFSGHYYHKTHYFCEAPFFVVFTLLKELSRAKKSLSQLMKPFKKYFHSGEINFKISDKKKIIKEIEKRFKKGKPSYLDGLRVDFEDWWFNVRTSHTEPVLRLVVEAKTKRLMERKKKELTEIITLRKS